MLNDCWLTRYCHLVPYALKLCYIFPYHPDYEDYKQIAYEALTKAYQKLPEQKDAYYINAIRWDIQKEKHRQMKKGQHQVSIEDFYDQTFTAPIEIDATSVIDHLLLELPYIQKEILRYYLHPNGSFKALAQRLNCSVSHLYEERKKLIQYMKEK